MRQKPRGGSRVKVKSGVLAAFVAPCLPIAAIGLPVVVHLPPYYAGTLGLPLATVGLLFSLVRLVDVPIDPFVGNLIDRTHSRWGRYRPWFAAGILIMMAGVAQVFFASPGISAGVAFAGLLTMYLGFSSAVVSHTSWGAVLSDDYHERSRVFGWWQTANLLGLLTILFVPPLALFLAGARDATVGVHAMGWVILIALPVTLLLNLGVVPERAPRAAEHPTLKDIIGVARLPLLRRLLLVDLLANLAPGLAGALLIFFFEAARGYSAAEARWLLVPYFAAGMLSAPVWVRVARATSKHRTIVWALVGYAAALSVTLVIPPGNFTLALLGFGLSGIPAVAPLFLLRAMLADLSDAETLRTGKDRTALFYAALVAVQKLGYAIPVGLSYSILAIIGFDPKLGQANSPEALTGLVIMFVAPPVLLSLLAALIVRGWPIDAEAQATNARALKQ
ncbi:hypothetical protein IP88_07010 [alpha proteobacterium AAP81b]|nr:hypothetical protein IP88_07010 [alpha proteobacterium AAP81b]